MALLPTTAVCSNFQFVDNIAIVMISGELVNFQYFNICIYVALHECEIYKQHMSNGASLYNIMFATKRLN